MKKNRPGRIGAKVSAALVLFSLVVSPTVLPAPVLAADSLASRGCATTPYNDNLVYNSSFENVTNGNFTIYTNPGGVTFWTTTNSQLQVVPSPNGYNNQNFTSGWPPYDGYYEAVLPSRAAAGGLTVGSLFAPRPGLVGTLAINYPNSTPTVVGTKYVLSARVSNIADNQFNQAAPVAIEMRLRNSATGAESAPVQATVPNNYHDLNPDGSNSFGHAWGLVSGTVTADQIYDKVVLRHYQDTGYAFVDDVVVCRASVPLPWWKNHGAQAGLVLFTLGSAGLLFIWHARRGKSKKTSKASRVAVADLDGDGKRDDIKVSENESPHPMNRILRPSNLLSISLAVVAVAGATIFVASVSGGIWKSKTPSPTNTPNVTGKLSPAAKDTAPAVTKTCVDKETVKEGYKLFRNEKYKYCILYPISMPTNSKNLAKVTFGTVPDGEPGPGWLTITNFNAKTVAARDEEIKVNFREPAGPCTESDVTLAGESGKKLDCTGAANGAHNIFYIISDQDGNLFELSYIGDLAASKISYDTQYRIMVDSFLSDKFANK